MWSVSSMKPCHWQRLTGLPISSLIPRHSRLQPHSQALPSPASFSGTPLSSLIPRPSVSSLIPRPSVSNLIPRPSSLQPHSQTFPSTASFPDLPIYSLTWHSLFSIMYRRKGQGNVLLSVSVSSTSIVQEAGFHTEWEGGEGAGISPPPQATIFPSQKS